MILTRKDCVYIMTIAILAGLLTGTFEPALGIGIMCFLFGILYGCELE